jgi:CubicO group peptidase (beta-lactamase class C family)
LTGRNIYDALEADIARPIGMEDFVRDRQRKSGDTTRSVHLAYHMWLSTRDMARIGYLMLREGAWNGKQVIPADWLRLSTSTLVPSGAMNPVAARRAGMGYGYLWWTLEVPPESPLAGSYSARGAYGQYIMVIPKLDLVVAHKRAVFDGRTGSTEAVSWIQFMGAVERVIAARCPGVCPVP